MRYRNLTDALYGSLETLLESGSDVPSRNGSTKELIGHNLVIEKPQERILITKGRKNNPFASLAETLWVLGGRNDVEFLSRYLPRAGDFSDDGKVWRGGYGPRLRDWTRDIPEPHPRDTLGHEIRVDQIEECVKILCEDINSRRAAMVIFDPLRDYGVSKDIPCNNWIHFLVREGKLNLTIGVRSNDVIWGFSAINIYEWSTLQQMMAHWIGVETGIISYTASSFHLYEHHFEMARDILKDKTRKTLYNFGIKTSKFETGYEDFDPFMSEIFEFEKRLWADPSPTISSLNELITEALRKIPDEFLTNALLMLTTWRIFKEWSAGREDRKELAYLMDEALRCFTPGDMRIAAIEFIHRNIKSPDLKQAFLNRNLNSDAEENFFTYYLSESREVSTQEVLACISTLHEKKSRTYGKSWRKAGEIEGIFANITRKVDRIKMIRGGEKALSDESLFDTYVDLSVYVAKYITFLAEELPEEFRQVFGDLDPKEFEEDAGGYDKVVNLLMRRSLLSSSVQIQMGKDCDCDEISILHEHLGNILKSNSTESVLPTVERLWVSSLKEIMDLTKQDSVWWERFEKSVEAL